MNYADAVNLLNTFINFERLPDAQMQTDLRDIGRFRALLEALGNPQDSFKIVHIAGTKGKGSTAYFIAAILTALGWRTGLYISPHLVTVRERIRVDGRMISKRDFASAIRVLSSLSYSTPAENSTNYRTVFEYLTAAAFLHFARRKVEFAVIETGLGGRLDATNVVSPAVSVVTPIDLDHTAILGDTVAKIAWDKAHIIKSGVPCLTAPQAPEALRELETRAREVGSDLQVIRSEDLFENVSCGLEKTCAVVKSGMLRGENLILRSPGRFQLTNLALALRAVDAVLLHLPPLLLKGRIDTEHLPPLLLKGGVGGGWELPDSEDSDNPKPQTPPYSPPAIAGRVRRDAPAIEGGGLPGSTVIVKKLGRLRVPARLQVLQKNPAVILDVAHNLISARALRAALDEIAPDRPLHLVFSAMKDKNIPAMLNCFADRIKCLYLAPLGFPRGADLAQLGEAASKAGCETKHFGGIPAAFDAAIRESGANDLILAFGSFHLAGEILRKRRSLPPPPGNGFIDARI